MIPFERFPPRSKIGTGSTETGFDLRRPNPTRELRRAPKIPQRQGLSDFHSKSPCGCPDRPCTVRGRLLSLSLLGENMGRFGEVGYIPGPPTRCHGASSGVSSVSDRLECSNNLRVMSTITGTPRPQKRPHGPGTGGMSEPWSRSEVDFSEVVGSQADEGRSSKAGPRSRRRAAEPVTSGAPDDKASATRAATSEPVGSDAPGGSAGPAHDDPDRSGVAWRSDDTIGRDDDALHRRGLADVIHQKLTSALGSGILTTFLVHVDGQWGAGKSTLLRFLKESLATADERWIVVEYDAWRHTKVGPPWLSLLLAVRAAVGRGFRSPVRRLWFHTGDRARLVRPWQLLAGTLLLLTTSVLVIALCEPTRVSR